MSDKIKDVKDKLVDVNTPLPDNETISALQAKLATYEAEKLELETLRAQDRALEIEERKINVELKKRELAKKMQEEATRLEDIKMKMMQIASEIRNREALQAQCTHMKGGMVTQADPSVVMNGHGSDSTDYSLIKHVLPTGREMILCQRCLKEWYSWDPLTNEKASDGYKEASRWPTKNHRSLSSQFRKVEYRQVEQ